MGGFLYKIFSKLLMFYCKLRKVKFEGFDNLPAAGPVVLIANHTYWTDPIFVALVYQKNMNRQVFFMAKEELFHGKIITYLLNLAGVFPVSRAGNDIKALKTALRHLRDGEVLGIFPEGTRYHHADDEPLADFKPGAVLIAYKGKSPVVPVGLENAKNLFHLTKPAPIVRIGEPIYFTDTEGKSKQEIIDEYMEICKAGLLKRLS
ncbi:MAG: lysophospholipid acyltransferase family protein [Bacillota bacterium]|jgi:1-acyl-sn-glycerol-3-phosphate acyltransferase